MWNRFRGAGRSTAMSRPDGIANGPSPLPLLPPLSAGWHSEPARVPVGSDPAGLAPITYPVNQSTVARARQAVFVAALAVLVFLPPPVAFRCRQPSEPGGGEVAQLTPEGPTGRVPVPLQGVWLLEKAEGGWAGLEKHIEWDIRDYLIHERGLTLSVLACDMPITRWFYSVGCEASPHTIDCHNVDLVGPNPEQGRYELMERHGILKIEGDWLTVCFCDVSSSRPTAFKPEGKAYSVLRFRKVSDERHGLRGIADKLAEMKADPKKCLADPARAEDPDFLEMLGYAFALGGRERFGRLSRAEAVAHLRRCLASADWMAVLQALTALERIQGLKTLERILLPIGERGTEEAPLVIPLLRHPVEEVRLAAVGYLLSSPDKRAVGPLCQALDEVEKDGDLGHRIGCALGRAGNPDAAPALERAVKRGIGGGTESALGAFGGKSAFEPLLDGVEKRDSMLAVEGLRSLIRRSNKKPEPWMDKVRWSEETGLTDKDKRRKWWEANKADFKVIKAAGEAFGWRK